MAQSAWILHVAKTRSEMKKTGKKFKPTEVFKQASKTFKKTGVSSTSKKSRKSKKGKKTRKVKKAKRGKRGKRGKKAAAAAAAEEAEEE